MDNAIIPECYADTLLIQTLVPPENGRGYNHLSGRDNVAALMRTGRLKGKFALGIVDDDKKGLPYLAEFEKIEALPGFLILWKHCSFPQYIIQICPALEKWVLDNCSIAQIDLSSYNLETLDKLKDITKNQTSLNNPVLKQVYSQLKTAAPPAVKLLSHWVKTLRDTPYTTTVAQLKTLPTV